MQTISQLYQTCEKDGIGVWQHICVWTTIFVNEIHQEQVENTTYWWPLARCYSSFDWKKLAIKTQKHRHMWRPTKRTPTQNWIFFSVKARRLAESVWFEHLSRSSCWLFWPKMCRPMYRPALSLKGYWKPLNPNCSGNRHDKVALRILHQKHQIQDYQHKDSL